MWSPLQKVLFSFAVVLCTILFFIFAARVRNSWQARILSPKGIQVDTSYHINGQSQAVRIRGENEDNPIVLYVHGGPGNPMAFLSYTYQKPLEKKFTIVHWDQRGSGRSYYQNGRRGPESEEQVMADLDTLIDLLRVQFHQDKVILLGHSWGTFLVSRYADVHPEKVLGIVSIGQMVKSMRDTELYTANEAKRIAEELGKLDAAKELDASIQALQAAENYGAFGVQNILDVRDNAALFLPHGNEAGAISLLWQSMTSPDANFNDLRWGMMTLAQPAKQLETQMALLTADSEANSVETITEYKMPIHFIIGSEDWVTPRPLVEIYMQQIKAPSKGLTILEGLGHSPMLQDQKLTSDTLMSALVTVLDSAQKKTP